MTAPAAAAWLPRGRGDGEHVNPKGLRLRDRRYFFGRRARILYELIGWRFRNARHLRFMNYGYHGALAPAMPDDPDLMTERFCAQLYHAVASQAPLAGRAVLDVGSGRGGGAAFLRRHHRPAQVVGLDFARQAIRFCERRYAGVTGLSFRHGDALAMPFAEESFDAILDVESAHCYADRRRFLCEARRVLRPGGALLLADFTPAGADPAAAQARFGAELAECGFSEISFTDLTAGILQALDRDGARRAREIDRAFPPGTRRLARLWAGTPGSWIHDDFRTGRRAYFMLHAVRPPAPLAGLVLVAPCHDAGAEARVAR